MKPHARTEKQAVDAADLHHEAGAPAAARSLPYETIALVLQGGGALGAYQAGVFEGLHEAGVPLDWIAGILHATPVLILNVGHYPQAQRPDVVVPAVLELLATLPRTGDRWTAALDG